MEDAKDSNEKMPRLRIGGDSMGHPKYVSNEQKDKIIHNQKEELVRLKVEYNNLTLKYKGVQQEFESYKEMMADHINRISRDLSAEARREMQRELNDKQHAIEELKHEVKSKEMLVTSLRKSLNESNKEKVEAQQRQPDITKLQEIIQEEKESLGKLEQELRNEREKNNELVTQVKELMQQCDEYADKEDNSEEKTSLQSKNKELVEELILMKRENDDLKYQINEWQNLLSEYEKRSGKQDKENTIDLNELNSVLKTIKNQIKESLNSSAVSFHVYHIGWCREEGDGNAGCQPTKLC
eukprot:TRINITY_DN11386_c0_g1_i3.p1 TRINITY_DN11386_c0_g1~~TRINITY_DN11386_c0_g1_i3.p1  ORF type:complete len:297 (+),score=89.22 TRINITY_DN11386_c0_g1_i3:284-1174(+)